MSTKKKSAAKKKKLVIKKAANKKTLGTRKKAPDVSSNVDGLRAMVNGLKADNERLSEDLSRAREELARAHPEPFVSEASNIADEVAGLRTEVLRLKDELTRTRAALAVYTDAKPGDLPALARDNTGLNLTKVSDEGAPKGTSATVVPAKPAMDMFATLPAPDPKNTNLTRAAEGEDDIAAAATEPSAPAAHVTPLAEPEQGAWDTEPKAAAAVGPEDPTEESEDEDDESDDDEQGEEDDTGDIAHEVA